MRSDIVFSVLLGDMRFVGGAALGNICESKKPTRLSLGWVLMFVS